MQGVFSVVALQLNHNQLMLLSMVLVSVVCVVSSGASSLLEELYFAGNETLTWRRSLTFCGSFGSSLASIHSIDEYNAVMGVCLDINLKQDTELYCWTGLNTYFDIDYEGQWQWSDGTSLSFGFDSYGQPVNARPWADGQPSNDNSDEDCVEIDFRTVGLNDVSCEALQYAMCNAVSPAASVSPYFVSGEVMNWTHALSYCESFGTSLASIHSLNDSVAASEASSDASIADCWVGLSRSEDLDSQWQWSDGSAIDFAFTDAGTPVTSLYQWRYDEPNNFDGAEHCVEYRGYTQAMNDNSCLQKTYPICNAVTSTSHPTTAAPSQDQTTQLISHTSLTFTDSETKNQNEVTGVAISFTSLVIIIASVVVACGGLLLCSILIMLHYYKRKTCTEKDDENHERNPLSMSDLKVEMDGNHNENDDLAAVPPSPQPGMEKAALFNQDSLKVQAIEANAQDQEVQLQTLGKKGEISTTSVFPKPPKTLSVSEGFHRPHPLNDLNASVSHPTLKSPTNSYYEDMYDSVEENVETKNDE